MTVALWIIAVSQAIQTTLHVRARGIKTLLPKVLRRNKRENRVPKVTELP